MKRNLIYLKIIIFFGIVALYQISFTGSNLVATEDWMEEKIRQKHAFRDYKLSAEEEQIINLLDSTRSVKGVEPLEVNLTLSKGIKDRLEIIINKQEEKDSVLIVKELSDFMSFLGGKTFLIQGESVPEILNRIRVNQNLAKELITPDTLTFSLSCIKDSIAGTWYSVIYFTNYYIEASQVQVITGGSYPGGSDIQDHNYKANGKTNAKYIKYMIYQGTVLPFYYEGNKMTSEEIRTKDDGSFPLEFSYYYKGATPWRVAIFARDNMNEPYSLVRFWAL